ncbi:Ig-like domain-containing protein [Listeria sp. PSOL-1]|uniref:Ig-like domain-containing protein n=1 Tax=Listeria sp. PSOL-1 TaxID=1844999 RepID=UPI0013D0A45B|nr:Ig-like domain-containing protein [Listeria sp. PSOL-1]
MQNKKLIKLLIIIFAGAIILGVEFPAKTTVKAGSAATYYSTFRPLKINQVSDTDLRVTGTATPNISIRVRVKNYVFRGCANKYGDFSIKLNKKYPEGTAIEVEQYRLFSSERKRTIVQSTASVTEPQVNEVSTTDQVITGISRSPQVKAVINGAASYSYPNQKTGEFTINLGRTYSKGTVIKVYAINGSLISNPTQIIVIEKQVVLEAPLINKVTTEDEVITGQAGPDLTVKLTIGQDLYEAETDQNGHFTVYLDHKYTRDTVIYAHVTNGNVNSAVTEAVVEKGRYNLGVNAITNIDRVITGITEPYSKMTVRIGNRVYTGTATETGAFSIELGQTYQAGQNVTVKSKEPNYGVEETKVVIIYPAPPTVNTIAIGAESISGTASPNALVIVTLGGKMYQGFANRAGDYDIPINPNDAVTGAIVYVKQISNNVESYSSEVVIGEKSS